MELTQWATAFLQGLLAAFSSCVYPLIPITTALFTGTQAKFKKGLILSGLYVLGMAVTYVSLGILAALFGKIFGSWMASKEFMIFLVLIFLYLAFGFVGLFPLPLPQFSDSFAHKQKGKILYPLILGIFSGFIAAPCTAPFYGATLAQISQTAAKKESLMPGIIQAFSFALGMGFPFFWVGGLAMRLPKPGKWLYFVKYFGAIVLLTAAWHYAENIFGPFLEDKSNLQIIPVGFLLASIGYFLSEPHLDMQDKKKVIRFFSSFWLLVSAFGMFLVTSPVAQWFNQGEKNTEKTLAWHSDLPSAKMMAKKEKSDILIDFWAEWCSACHEMENKLFQDKEFQDLVQAHKLTLLRLDFTEPDEATEKLAEKYNIRGLPTLVLADYQGNMYHSIVGFYSKKATLAELRFALKKRNKNEN